MEYVKLGNTGVNVSWICFGCMSYGIGKRGAFPLALVEERSRTMIKKAIYLGINLKVFFPMLPGPNGSGLFRKEIMSEIDKSLKRLGTDYVDLYYIHRCDNK